MGIASPTSHKQERYILKSNLWKFFKSLRVQAHPIWCMLVASPVDYAWITVADRQNINMCRRITIAQFVNSFSKMPSAGKCYRLGINLYYPSIEYSKSSISEKAERCWQAVKLSDLSIEKVEGLFMGIVAHHCMKSIQNGETLELTPRVIQHYRFKERYIEDLKVIIGQCNRSITMNLRQSDL